MSASQTPLSDIPTAADAIATTSRLVKEYSGRRVLDGIDLTVPYGVIVGLIGPSGCGKTTLVRHLVGVLGPTSGEVRVFGGDPRRLATGERSRFGYMPQQPALFPNLTVWRNLTFMSSVYGVPLRHRRRRLRQLLQLVELQRDRRKLVKECSGGMQRRLMLAATLVHDPELLILDEPSAGVDPLLRARLWEHLRELRDRGKTIIVPTQYVGEAASCDLVAVMSEGRLLALLPPADLRRFAYDGDVVAFAIEEGLSRANLDRLARLPGVHSIVRTQAGIRVAVDDASTRRRELTDTLTSMGVTAVEEPFESSYEDIFVAIIERDRARLEAAAS
jgi:ABC-2 type transport system ATP-binding protein